ncbi:MAG: class I SAM-dependent methyltransferase [Armatimonadota bacterium]
MGTDVATAYDALCEKEWQRLDRQAYSALEFKLTMHYLQQHLPPGGTVLDAGGGPGRYAIALCRLGYQVTLLDLSPGNIAIARTQFAAEPSAVQANLQEASVGDIRALPFVDGQFDAVLCLGGPLSHIPEPEDRRQSVNELVRVAKSGSIICLTGIGYLAVLRTIMVEFDHELINGSLDHLLADGNTYGPMGMLWHFFRAEELRALGEAAGLQTLEMAGLQSLSTGLEEATNRLRADEAKWGRWFEELLRHASDLGVVDMAEHILYIGRKPCEP